MREARSEAMIMMAPSGPGTVLGPEFWGLSGLVVGDLTKLVLREWWMPPCTIDAWRLWAYETEGLRSTGAVPVPSGLELVVGMTTAGVCERGETVRPETVGARPRAT